MAEIRIVGPQFSDPYLFVRWLSDRFTVEPSVQTLGEADRYLELSIPMAQARIHVLAAVPAYWDVTKVHDVLLEKADAIILMLNRVESLASLNPDIIQIVKQHAMRLGVTPIVVANDPHGGNPEFQTVPTSFIQKQLNEPWPIFETTIGPFEPVLRWSTGAELVFTQLLSKAHVQSA